MNYAYHFADPEREVCIHSSVTPAPWMNYLSNGTMHAMISQAGGGLAFYKSPQIWRINHYRFFHLPTDRSGFYTYISDGDTIWCPTAEPVSVKPDSFKAFHGLGYTRFEAEKNGLRAKVRYFIGPLDNCMIWNIKLSSDTPRHITLFPYVELGMMEFERELRWQCYNKHQLRVTYLEDIKSLVYEYHVEMQPRPEETPLIYFTSDAPVAGYDGDRDEFVGSYRSEEMPVCVERRLCTNSQLYGGDPCFALQLDIDLSAGEQKELNVFLGAAASESDIRKSAALRLEKDFVKKSFEGLNKTWHTTLSKQQCALENQNIQRMVNIWNPYQTERNFQFSRNISYYATGTFRGVGFRDTAQDIIAMAALDAPAALEKLMLLLSQQYQDGHVNHYFFPTEGYPPVTEIRSDNHLWLIFSVYQLIMETGDAGILMLTSPYFDGGSDTLWEHLKKSVSFTLANRGRLGFPLMLRSDWNDMLYKVCREGLGESVWTAMQFGTALLYMDEMAGLVGDRGTNYTDMYEEQKKLVDTVAWDGEWFRRATTDSGRFIGSKKEPQAKIWLNTQSWSVISGMASREKAVMAMDSVKKYLDTEMGIKKIHPAMLDYPSKDDPLTHYNKGCGENGSVFCHANCWAIIAECMLKRAEHVDKYYTQLLPMVASEKAGAWRYKAEPYVYSSNIFGPESDRFGLANVSWLTGTAAWMYIAVTQYIFGVKPVWGGLLIDPCVPESWGVVEVNRIFRGCRYHITIRDNDTVFIPHEDGREFYETANELQS